MGVIITGLHRVFGSKLTNRQNAFSIMAGGNLYFSGERAERPRGEPQSRCTVGCM